MIELRDTAKMYGLPLEVKFCKRCTISNQRPRIGFDEEGVCSACRFAEHKRSKIDWLQREKELRAVCDRFRKSDGGFDVVVPSSGGKDSSSVAHKLKEKYGMHPLTVTWSPHLYTEIGWKNFQSAIHVGGLDNLLGTPSGVTHRKMTRLAFEILGDPFQPFIYGQVNYPAMIAAKFKIPFMVYGECGEAEYGGDIAAGFRPTRDYRTYNRSYYFSGLSPEDLVRHGIDRKDLFYYMAPPVEELDALGFETHFFSYYEKWVPQENYYYCIEHTGFHANPGRSEGTYSKYASLDDKLDGFHYYLAFIKFGLGRATSDSAHEIRDGHITREEGVELVRKYDGEFPQKHFKEFLEYCDIKEDFFWEVVNSWRSPHLWKKENGEWKLKVQVS